MNKKKMVYIPLLIDFFINLYKGFLLPPKRRKHPLSQGSEPFLRMAQIHNQIWKTALENELWHVGTRT